MNAARNAAKPPSAQPVAAGCPLPALSYFGYVRYPIQDLSLASSKQPLDKLGKQSGVFTHFQSEHEMVIHKSRALLKMFKFGFNQR